tara:strand:- start:2837 stop:3118 length:282 start_codon:yes stop_codon:yes gene_type:complete
MHYLVLASEYDELGDSWVVKRTFTSDEQLTKKQLEEMFLLEHYKNDAKEGSSESTENWTDEDFEDFYNEGQCKISVEHFYQSLTPVNLEEVAN